ncbi:Topoisom_bac domain-containing protein/zf-C4_Topoisom domain-containing protein/Toprim domain-containing protein/zf-GRF domain-containing protein, partial [Cephalotus follicularis]
KVLNVAEKPSVAKSVSSILSRNQGLRVREGRSRYNKIFEFNCRINGQPCHMLFTSVTGHLMELDFDDRYRKWHSCDPADLYQAPVRKFVPEDKKDIKRTLEEEARRCQWLVLWLDCDREGENIAFEVIEVCRAVNRNLTIRRARFSALIDREIHHSVQNLVDANQWFADAVDARQEIDLRIGASFTRFQTMLLRDKFAIDSITDEKNLVLSYGPCQFPTLGFVVERYWEIQSHEPEEFWTINCSHKSDESIATFNWMRGHLFDYTSAVIIYEMCIQEPTATVTKVRQHEKLKYPPHPLSTIELEKRASRYFRMSSEHTMKVAEDLYQAGFISYPRTETDSFSERTDLHTIVREQQVHPVWGSYAERLLDPETCLWRNPSNGGHDDKAHPPIHPTKFSPGESGWSQDHHRLYELVVRHFLACVSQPAVGAETIVEIDLAGESFSASGRVIVARNYLDVYRFDSWGGSVIPTYVFGQQFIPTRLALDSGVTRPPSLLSEADLLSCMDKAGIGTDATMHDHIKKLLDRFYVTKDASTRFAPTNLGEALVMGYDDMGYELWKPNLRSMMEYDMKEVSVGNKRKAEVLATCLQQMKACFLDARLNKEKLLEAMAVFFDRSDRSNGDEQHATGQVVRRCRLCQESDMVLRRNRDGNFMVGCLGYPQCRNAVWLPGSLSEAAVTANVCNLCNPGPIYRIQFKFRQIEIPPGFDVNHLGCVGGCDVILRELIEICGTGSRIPAPARGRGANESSGNVQCGNTRQGACIYCRQTGHSSSNCRSQVSAPRIARSHSINPQSCESAVPCGTCGTTCILRTANTANNRGRKFFSCPSQECNFFVWEDNLNNGTGGRSLPLANIFSSASNPSRRGRGGQSGTHAADVTFISATGDPISGRRCYVCGDPSHFANVCPNRDN